MKEINRREKQPNRLKGNGDQESMSQKGEIIKV